MNEERGSLYLLTGVILGIVIGLFIAWGITPVEYTNTSPHSLRADFKDAYRAAIAGAYSSTSDLLRAEARLALLADDSPQTALIAQGQRYLAGGFSYADAQSLAALAAALGTGPDLALAASIVPTETERALVTLFSSPTMTPTVDLTALGTERAAPTATLLIDESGTPPSSSPTETLAPTVERTPVLTFTPLPTLIATATLTPPYVLENRVQICDPALAEHPQIQVFVSNDEGDGVSGVEIIMQWIEQEEHFFTGLKPEIGIGYADFEIIPQIIYTLHIADGGQVIAGLSSPECSLQTILARELSAIFSPVCSCTLGWRILAVICFIYGFLATMLKIGWGADVMCSSTCWAVLPLP
jgi:hypothetical protein